MQCSSIAQLSGSLEWWFWGCAELVRILSHATGGKLCSCCSGGVWQSVAWNRVGRGTGAWGSERLTPRHGCLPTSCGGPELLHDIKSGAILGPAPGPNRPIQEIKERDLHKLRPNLHKSRFRYKLRCKPLFPSHLPASLPAPEANPLTPPWISTTTNTCQAIAAPAVSRAPLPSRCKPQGTGGVSSTAAATGLAASRRPAARSIRSTATNTLVSGQSQFEMATIAQWPRPREPDTARTTWPAGPTTVVSSGRTPMAATLGTATNVRLQPKTRCQTAS